VVAKIGITYLVRFRFRRTQRLLPIDSAHIEEWSGGRQQCKSSRSTGIEPPRGVLRPNSRISAIWVRVLELSCSRTKWNGTVLASRPSSAHADASPNTLTIPGTRPLRDLKYRVAAVAQLTDIFGEPHFAWRRRASISSSMNHDRPPSVEDSPRH
jgi:hypothetical protein